MTKPKDGKPPSNASRTADGTGTVNSSKKIDNKTKKGSSTKSSSAKSGMSKTAGNSTKVPAGNSGSVRAGDSTRATNKGTAKAGNSLRAENIIEEGSNTRDADRNRSKEREREEDGDRRKKLLAILLCVLCLVVILILGLVLGLVLRHDKSSPSSSSSTSNANNAPAAPSPSSPTNPFAPTSPTNLIPTNTVFTPSPSKKPQQPPVAGPTPKPTPFPTVSPTRTPAPTVGLPPTLTLFPNADTSIANGLETNVVFGQNTELFVQNGLLDIQVNYDSVALLSFDLAQIPNMLKIYQGTKSATLQLHHVPNTSTRTEPAVISIFRLPQTVFNIETLNDAIYNVFSFTANQKVFGANFTVNVGDTLVQVDITDLVFLAGRNETQLLLLLENNGAIQARGTGDYFYSREYNNGAEEPAIILKVG